VDVVFLHANGFNARTYRSILAPLADRLRILAPDMRGHGATSLPVESPGRLDWYDLRDDLTAFLAALDLPPAVLAGHSMGATTSLLAAAQTPGRVHALALFDPVILSPAVASALNGPLHDSALAQGALRRRNSFPSRGAAFEAYRGRGAFRSWPDEMLADYVAAAFRDTPGGAVTLVCAPEWEASNYAAQGHDSWAALHAIRRPIRILRAEKDSTARLDEGLERLIAGGQVRVETIAGTTHFLPMERPELVREAILEAAA